MPHPLSCKTPMTMEKNVFFIVWVKQTNQITHSLLLITSRATSIHYKVTKKYNKIKTQKVQERLECIFSVSPAFISNWSLDFTRHTL